jgi:hypothetical protein
MQWMLARCGAAVAVLVLPGCDCSQVGCLDQLRVEVRDAAGAPVEDFTGEAIFEGRSYPFRCVPGNVQESSPYFVCFPGFLLLRLGTFPDQLELRVEGAGGGRFVQQLAPEAELFYPNGKRCGPECEQATVTAPLS